MEQEIAKGIAFTMVAASDQIEDRAYAYRESFGEFAEKIADALVADLNIPVAPSAEAAVDDSDPLGGLEVAVAPHVEQLLARLQDPSQAGDLATRIIGIHDIIKNSSREADRRTVPLSELRRAATILAALDICALDEKLRGEASAVLNSIRERVEALSARLAQS